MSRPSHLVLIPSYNTGPRLMDTVREARAAWPDVWVVVDGSTDASDEPLGALAGADPGIRVLRLPANSGKGAAALAGAEAALGSGFSHALLMDADGQHPAGQIAEFMGASRANPDAMILGRPVFGPEAPAVRRLGRKLSVALVHLETLGRGIADPLFGFRVYPLGPLVRIMRSIRNARGYDFDSEMAVRLWWAGTPAVNLAAACRYLSRAQGGVSHFRYVRDNLRLAWLHIRLLAEMALRRWPALLRDRRSPA